MGTNCVPLDANLFLFRYESDLMSLPNYNKANVIETFHLYLKLHHL